MISLNIQKALLGAHGAMQLDISLEIKEHSFIAISGESGGGKSTLLRILAGLEIASGSIQVDDIYWLNKNLSLAPQKRDIGFVFQDYALFNNMSIEKNLLFANNDKLLATKLLQLTKLDSIKSRLPNTLSGGQKQRVALCRALMNRPKLLLMDEPLSALDPDMRTQLQNDILKLHKEFGTTTIMVSHDPSEIYRLANRVIVIKEGKISQDATPKEVLLHAKGSQKFSLVGELLEIIQADVIYIAIVAIGAQIVEVVLDTHEAKTFTVGERVIVSTKAFAPTLTKLQ